MKIKTFASLTAMVGVLCLNFPRLAAQAPAVSTPAPAPAAATPASTTSAPAQPDIKTQLQALIAKINTKLKAGPTTEAALAPELAEFDGIIAAHKGGNPDDLAQVLVMKAGLYLSVLGENDKALPLLKQIVKDYPNAAVAKQVAALIPGLETQAQLVVGAVFPDFAVQDLAGKPLSVANYKGKIVLVDFWATWCGPCMAEMPNVIAAYNKYHSKGFEIIGVSLDRNDPGEKDKLVAFLKDHQMPWPQYYDGKNEMNDVAVKYGINAIPASFLIGPDGKILALSPRGPALAPAIETALATLAPAPAAK